MPKSRRNQSDGLTLIELLVVIAVLGLVAATVTSRVGAMFGPAALQQSVSEWEFTDRQVRERARHTGQNLSIHIEIGGNRLLCTLDPEPGVPPTTRTLSRGVRITKYVSARQELAASTATITYDQRGATETFAIELAGHAGKRRWLLVAGLSGQITEVADENTARQLLQHLLPPSLHVG